MNRKLLGASAAVVLAAMGTFVLVSFVRGAEQRALAGERLAQVYVVAAPIAKGTQGEAVRDSLTVERVPLKVRAAGAISDLADLDDKVAAVDLLPGEQLVEARFISPEDVSAGQVDVPDGLLETTIALSPERALGGNLKPGDTVALTTSFEPFDIEGTVDEKGQPLDGEAKKTGNTTHIILHKVLVTNVQGGAIRASTTQEPPATDGTPQQAPQPPQSAPGGPGAQALMVTLALDAPSVERVVFAAEFGLVWLSAEPEDAPEDGTQVQTRGTIYE